MGKINITIIVFIIEFLATNVFTFCLLNRSQITSGFMSSALPFVKPKLQINLAFTTDLPILKQ